MHRSPQASIGFKMLAASMAPSVLPAPRIKWHSSTNRKSDLRPFCTYPALLSTTLQVLLCTCGAGNQNTHVKFTQSHILERQGCLTDSSRNFNVCSSACCFCSSSCAYGSLAPSKPGPPPRPTPKAAVLTASHN